MFKRSGIGLALVSLVLGIASLLMPTSALAVSANLGWIDQHDVRGTIAGISGTAVGAKVTPGTTVTFTSDANNLFSQAATIIVAAGNCEATAALNAVTGDHASAQLSIRPAPGGLSSPGSTTIAPCTDAQLKAAFGPGNGSLGAAITQYAVTLANTDNYNNKGTITDAKTLIITSNAVFDTNPTDLSVIDLTRIAGAPSALAQGNAPASDTFTVTGNGVNQTFPGTLVPSLDNAKCIPNTAGGTCSGKTTDSTGSYIYGPHYQSILITNVNPGTYKICSKVAENCITYKKVAKNGVSQDARIDGKNKAYTVDLTSYILASGTPSCDVGSGTLDWILCPIITLVNTTADKTLKDVIVPLLYVNPATIGNLKPLWQGLVYLADVFFVIIFMVVIFGAAFGLKNYSVKRILPRVIAAAILIQFSYYIGAMVIDIGNVTGIGMAGLISTLPGSPGQGASANISALAGVFDGLLAFGAIAVLGIGVVLFATLSIALGVLTILVTLVFRQLLLAVLVVMAPLAFAAWVLPNTESFFKQWWKNLLKLSLMYPIISLIIGVAGIMAKAGISVTDITVANANNGGIVGGISKTSTEVVTKAVISLLPVFALFAVGLVSRGSGTLLSAIDKQVGKRGRRGASQASGAARKPGKAMMAGMKTNRQAAKATRLGNKAASGSRVAGLRAGYGMRGFSDASKNRYDARLQTAKLKHAKDEHERLEFKHYATEDADLKNVALSTQDDMERAVVVGLMASHGAVPELEQVLAGQYYQSKGGVGGSEWQKAIKDQHRSLREAGAEHLISASPPAPAPAGTPGPAAGGASPGGGGSGMPPAGSPASGAASSTPPHQPQPSTPTPIIMPNSAGPGRYPAPAASPAATPAAPPSAAAATPPPPPFRGPGTTDPAGVVRPVTPNPANPYSGTIDIPRMGGAPSARATPRLSERVVDPRVEGQDLDQLR